MQGGGVQSAFMKKQRLVERPPAKKKRQLFGCLFEFYE